jgi:hypothetical protein
VSIDKDSIKLIHVLKAKCALTDDEYRAMLVPYKAESSLDLTAIQAARFIDTLKDLARSKGVKFFNDPPPPRRGGGLGGGERPRWFATPAQLRKIVAMWHDVSRQTDPDARRKALDKWLYKRFGFGSLDMVSKAKVGAIIKALESMEKCEVENPHEMNKYNG